MRKKKDEELLRLARERFTAAADYESENREWAVEDLEFIAGNQWPQTIESARNDSHQPCLTINRLPGFIRQLVSDARQNMPSIKVHPVDDNSDPDTAEIYNGLIRQIAMASQADQAYDTAIEGSASAGFGYFRILTEYADDDVFEQDIRFKRIVNNFSVYFDPAATNYDKSDARWCHVTEWIDEEVFEARYPKAAKSDYETDSKRYGGEWFDGQKRVRISEYWVKEPEEKTLYLLSTGETVTDVTKDELTAQGFEVIKERQVTAEKVIRYLISGAEVLKKEEWAGKYIPIIPVYGPELHIENRVIYHSLIRFAKDPQRLYNYWQSAIAEKIALAPKSPFIMTAKQISGHETLWNNANAENRAYLLYNPDPQAPPPQRQMPATLNPAELQQSAQAIEDLKATTGIYDASLGAKSNETSGRAIIARQREGDAATFTWLDNLARSIAYAGRILIDLIPKIYDTERVVRVMGEDGAADFKPINSVMQTAQGPQKIHDLGAGKYDLVVSVGPNYATQRIEAQDILMKFAQAVPQAGQVAPDIIARTLDIQYSDELADRLKKILPPGLVEPEEGEEQPAPPQQPPPSPEQLIALKEAEMKAEKNAVEIEQIRLENADKQFELSAKTGQMQQQVEGMVVDVLRRVQGGMV